MIDPVCKKLRELLEAERAQGARFTQVWERCIDEAVLVAPRWERVQWREVLRGMRGVWIAAYLGDGRIGGKESILAEHDGREPLHVRCAREECRRILPFDKRSGARFCSTTCQKAWEERHERIAA